MEVGPGRHCPSAKSSRNSPVDVHLSRSMNTCRRAAASVNHGEKVVRAPGGARRGGTFWKRAMCAAGPPKAVHPSSTNCLKMSLKPTSAYSS